MPDDPPSQDLAWRFKMTFDGDGLAVNGVTLAAPIIIIQRMFEPGAAFDASMHRPAHHERRKVLIMVIR